MKQLSLHILLAVLMLCLVNSSGFAQQDVPTDVPQTISYQGLLTASDGTAMPNGVYDITVMLFTNEAGTDAIWQQTYQTSVVNGVFNLYLGSGNVPLPGSQAMNRPLWIGTSVNGTDMMKPFTPLTSSPYALNLPDNAVTTNKLADNAVTADKVGMDYIAGLEIDGQQVSGNGAMLKLKSSDKIAVTYDEVTQTVMIDEAVHSSSNTGDKDKSTEALVGGPTLWSVGGDGYTVPSTGTPYAPVAGDWIGTQGNIVFDLRTRSISAMRYHVPAAGSPNVEGGLGSTVALASQASTIAGGNTNSITGNYDAIGGGRTNAISEGDYDVVGGGFFNRIFEGDNNTVGGGSSNTIGSAGVVPGPFYATISGGLENINQGGSSTIGGGQENQVYAGMATIGGGANNYISANGREATIAGGHVNTIEAYVGGITSGHDNTIAAGSDFSFIGAGQMNMILASTHGTIGGGRENLLNDGSDGSFIGGGQNNTISGRISTIGGGEGHNINAPEAVIAGGHFNTIDSYAGSIVGGHDNIVGSGSNYGIVGGGQNNTISEGTHNTVGGGQMNNVLEGTHNFVGGGLTNNVVGNQYGTIAGGMTNTINGGSDGSFIGGGQSNSITGTISTIGGGEGHTITAPEAVIAGGHVNSIESYAGAIVGGHDNRVASNSDAGFIGGGRQNVVDARSGAIGGGEMNNVNIGSDGSFIGGGMNNNITGNISTIGGGEGHTINAPEATIAGGHRNTVNAYVSAIAGGHNNTITSTATHSFIGGGLLNVASANYSTIGGGQENTTNGSHTTIPGGDLLRTTASYAQSAMGFLNAPRGTVGIRPATGALTDDPLFMVGNGDYAGGGIVRSNAFEVSYNGHSVVYDVNGTGGAAGPGRPAIKGGTYTDNVIYGWSEVDQDGNLICDDFGVAEISHINTGVYRITLNISDPDGVTARTISCGAAVATIGTAMEPGADEPPPVECAMIRTSIIMNNVFDVYITRITPDSGDCREGIDLPFKFHVTGRIDP